jgi:hypothetical protein
MSIPLILFISSGAAIIILIALKMLQQKLGILLFWPDVREKGEIALQRQADKIRQFTDGFTKRSIYILMHFVLVKIRTFFVFIQQKIDKRLIHLMNLIKGRQNLDRSQASSSHFLHDISKFKDKFRRQ